MKKIDKKETKKKSAPVAKKAAAKPKKEVKKEVKPRKAAKAKPVVSEEKPKIIAPQRIESVNLAHVEEKKTEVKAVPQKKNPPRVEHYHSTGGRKTSIARVWLSAGQGNYLINGRQVDQYANGRRLLINMATDPFKITNTTGKYNVTAHVSGGGYCSQIGAVRQAVSNALIEVNPDFRGTLKKAGFLTRDPREKERKKYGQKRARKRFQYSKR
jgi:small subunit ribosomal protein S9